VFTYRPVTIENMLLGTWAGTFGPWGWDELNEVA
jgi:hypothetical protein